MSARFVKLVRDGIPEAIDTEGQRVEYWTLTREEHILELRKKLIEEGLEYMFEPTLEELADAYEVVISIAHVEFGEHGPDMLRRAALEKRVKRGSFMKGLGMFAPLRDEVVDR